MTTDARRLVGRAEERASTDRLLDALAGGRAGVVLLIGEPGIGKTRLAEDATARAEALGLAVRTVRALPLTTPLPLEPISALLLDEQAEHQDGADARRERFTDALVALKRLARTHPTLLVVDDVQWADQETIGFLRYAIQRTTTLPAAWLLATRPGHGAELLAEDLRGLPTAQVVRLGGLPRVQLPALAAQVLDPQRITSAVLDTVYRRTGGNPFLMLELLRAAATSEPADIDLAVVPAGIRGSVDLRRRALDPTQDEVLRWCAVLPQPAPLDWVTSVAGPDALDAIPTLIDQALLVTDDGAVLRFAHEILRDAVYASLLAPERVQRHQVVADLLADAGPGLRAPQLLGAGRSEEAAAAYVALADEALRRGGAADALTHAERAESLARRVDAAAVASDARIVRVLSLLRLGSLAEARELADALRRRLATDPTPRRVRFLARYAMACWDDASDLTTAMDVIDELVELLGAHDSPSAAEGLLAQAQILNRAGRSAEALPVAEQAAALARTVGPVLEARALIQLGLIRGLATSARAGMAVLETALDLAQEHDLPMEEAYCWLDLSFLAEHAGDDEAYERYARRGLQVDSVPPSLQALLLANAAQGPVRRGELDLAVAELEQARAIAARAGRHVEQRVVLTMVHALIRRGELERTATLLEDIEVDPASIEGQRVAYARAFLAEEQGELDTALACYRIGTQRTDHPSTIWSLAGVVRTSAALGRIDDAAAALTMLEDLAHRWEVSAWLLTSARGALALARGEHDTAAALFDDAAAQRDDRFHRTSLRLAAGLARQDPAGVRAAIEELEEMGAKAAASRGRTRALQQEIDLGPPRRARAVAPPAPLDAPLDAPSAAQIARDRRATSLAEVLDTWEHASRIHTRVCCLGPLEVERDGATVALPAGRPAALVGLLALDDRPQRLTSLMDALWPGIDERAARVRLRQVLYRLRRAAPELVVRRDHDRIGLHGEVIRDLEVFRRLGDLAGDRGEVGTRAAQAALAMVRGPLLDGLAVDDEPGELDLARRAVDARRAVLHARLAQAALDAGHLDEAIDQAGDAVRCDPTDERRAVMLAGLLRRAGRDADARAVLATTVATLRQLGLQPGVDLRTALRHAPVHTR